MFELVYTKIQKKYKYVSKLYAMLAVDKPFSLIAFYLISTLCLSIWIFQIRLITDNESLTYVKNSDYLKNKKTVDHEFPLEPKNRYFQNQLSDVGYYSEMILKLKNTQRTYPPGQTYSDYETNNFINETIFAQFNKIFDEILNITIETDSKNQSSNSSSFRYIDVCPKRLGRPAIEGGVIRNKEFQRKLLIGTASFLNNDPGCLIIEARAQEGSSANYVFGKLLKTNCTRRECFITHIGQIRTRFDLISTTAEDKEIALKFLHKFVEHMERLQSDMFDFTYHTSHTLETEIIKYSILDLPYVQLALGFFWLSFFVLMSVDVDFLNWKIISEELESFKKSDICSHIFKLFCRFWLNGAGFMVLITFIQFFLTILSTLGLMSLLDIAINQLLNTIIFVLMINTCHQSLLLYKNFKRIDRDGNKHDKYSFCYPKCPVNCISETDEEEENTKLFQIFSRLVHTIMVPNLFALLTTTLAYSVIGLTSGFDSISTYCLFMIVCLGFNFLGQVFFYCPWLIVHLRKAAQNKTNLLCCLYRSDEFDIQNDSSNAPDENNNNADFIPESEDSPMNQNTDEIKKTTAKFNLNDLLENFSAYKFNLLHSSKFKYVILVLFGSYFISNAFVCGFKVNIDIPISELLPAKSYLAKHMTSHLRDFDLGPMIMFNFMQPMNASDTQKIKKINHFIDDVNKLDGINGFVISCLKFFQDSQREYQDFYSDPFQLNYQSIKSTKANQFYDDIYYKVVNFTSEGGSEARQEVVFEKFRIYVQIQKLTGSTRELNLMHDIQHMIDSQFVKGEVFAFSAVYPYIEQLGEIFPSIFALVAILLESVFFISLFLLFDLRSIGIKMLVFLSLVLAIFSNLYIFNISLNIVTLYQMIMLPALLIEFFFYTMHLYLFKITIDSEQSSGSSQFIYSESRLVHNKPNSSCSLDVAEKKSTHLQGLSETALNECGNEHETDGETFTNRNRFRRLQFALDKNVNLSSLYLLFISLFSFSFMSQCETYNFHTLCLLLMITCINSLFHIHFLYPGLLSLLGASWPSKKKRSRALKKVALPTDGNMIETCEI